MLPVDLPYTLLSLNPLVVVIDGVFDEGLANHIISKGDGTLQRGVIVDPKVGMTAPAQLQALTSGATRE